MNIASPPKKVEYAIVCDDVRREDNGKLIIIGLYGSDITLSSYPANLRLSILVAVRSKTEHQTLVKMRIMRDGERMSELKEKIELSVPAEDITVFSLSGITVSAEKDAILDFQIRFDQGRYRSACKLKMRQKSS